MSLTNLFGDLGVSLMADFFGMGAVAPESVARKVLGLPTGLPLTQNQVVAAFRARVRALRPDLTDSGADALRLRDISPSEVPSADAETSHFQSGSKQEQLAELLWAREDLIRRIPRPVTVGEGGVTHGDATLGAVTHQLSPEQQAAIERVRRQEERQRAARAERSHQRLCSRYQRYRHNRKVRKPSRLICISCRGLIEPTEPLVWAEWWTGKPPWLQLWPYSSAFHPACLPSAVPLRTTWIEQRAVKGAVLEAECQVCGRLVKPPRWLKRNDGTYVYYCSQGCAAGADKLARHVTLEDRDCAQCAERFTPQRADAQFCSAACRQRAYRARRRDQTIDAEEVAA